MAYYFLFPEKDTTIYSHPDRTQLNAGSDEILEITKEKGVDDQRYYPSRILIKFKNEEVKDVIDSIIGSSTFNNGISKTSLQLFSTEHKNLTSTLNLDVFAISQSWDEGTGRFTNIPIVSNGCSWIYRDNDIARTQWPTGSVTTTTNLTFGSSSININQLPVGSAHEITINGIDFIPVISSSLFENSFQESYITIGTSTDTFGLNLASAINASSSQTLVTATYITSSDSPANTLILSGSTIGTNVIITTSSISGNTQAVFTSSVGDFSVQGAAVSSVVNNFAPDTSGSIDAFGITKGGGSWYAESSYRGTQQFLHGDNLDVDIDVTSIVKRHSSSLFSSQTYPLGVENNGFLIKQPDSVEEDISSSFGELKYFSADSHTIYPPKLCFKWDDSVYTGTSNNSIKNSGELSVSLYGNKEEYNQNDEATFRIHVRDKYPVRQFASSSNFLNPGHFRSTSFYSIRDAHTEQVIIPFDDTFTKLSADSEGMYFKIYMKALQPERYYRILFKHVNNDGTIIYDNNYNFKVIR